MSTEKNETNRRWISARCNAWRTSRSSTACSRGSGPQFAASHEIFKGSRLEELHHDCTARRFSGGCRPSAHRAHVIALELAGTRGASRRKRTTYLRDRRSTFSFAARISGADPLGRADAAPANEPTRMPPTAEARARPGYSGMEERSPRQINEGERRERCASEAGSPDLQAFQTTNNRGRRAYRPPRPRGRTRCRVSCPVIQDFAFSDRKASGPAGFFSVVVPRLSRPGAALRRRAGGSGMSAGRNSHKDLPEMPPGEAAAGNGGSRTAHRRPGWAARRRRIIWTDFRSCARAGRFVFRAERTRLELHR